MTTNPEDVEDDGGDASPARRQFRLSLQKESRAFDLASGGIEALVKLELRDNRKGWPGKSEAEIAIELWRQAIELFVCSKRRNPAYAIAEWYLIAVGAELKRLIAEAAGSLNPKGMTGAILGGKLVVALPESGYEHYGPDEVILIMDLPESGGNQGAA